VSAYRKGLRAKAVENIALVKEFYDKYQSRITQGLSIYGEFDANSDKRVLSHEAIEECLDIGSYLDFLEQKHPTLRLRIQKVRANTILLYGALKALEEAERTQAREGDL